MASEIINIEYKVPKGLIHQMASGSPRSVSIKEVLDLRGKDPRFIMNKLTLAGGPASGAYMAQKPVCEILNKAIFQAFELAGGKNQGKTPDLFMSAKLVSMDFAVMVGFAKCMLKGVIKMEVALTAPDTKDRVWEGTIEGVGRCGAGDLVQEVFSTALDDFILKLLSSPFFSV